MRIEGVNKFNIPPAAFPLPLTSPTLSTLHTLEKEATTPTLPKHTLWKSKVFFEDLYGFIRNLILWPVHGHNLILHQIIFSLAFLMILPIVLPIIFFIEIIHVFIDFLCCGCLKGINLTPKFSLKEPTDLDKIALRHLTKPSTKLSFEEQIRLLYTVQVYCDFADKYNRDPFGKKHNYFNGLIKVQVGDKSHLMQYRPDTSREELLREYSAFLHQNYEKAIPTIQHTFVGLDYSYHVGMLSMKIATDTVEFAVEKVQVEQNEGFCFSFFSWFSKNLLTPTPDWGHHIAEDNSFENNFWMWPGYTREACCAAINSRLKGKDLKSYQISLLDLEKFVRL